MNKDKDQLRENQGQDQPGKEEVKKRRGAFNEPENRDEKSTENVEEEAEREQERKEALTERD